MPFYSFKWSASDADAASVVVRDGNGSVVATGALADTFTIGDEAEASFSVELPAGSYVATATTVDGRARTAAGVVDHLSPAALSATSAAVTDTPETSVSWRDKANGAPLVMDSGQVLRETHSAGKAAAALAVANGTLTNTYTGAGGAAGYIEVDHGEPVTLMGGTFKFDVATVGAGGTATMAICSENFQAAFPTGVPNLSCHLSILPERWDLAVYTEGVGIEVPASGITGGKFSTPLVAGKEYRVELYREGDTVMVLLPDGTTAVISDPRIASYAGNSGFWETFQTTAATDPRAAWIEMWSSSEFKPKRISARDIARAASKARRGAMPKVAWYAPGTFASTALPSSSTEINSALRLADVVVPESGYVLVASEIHAVISTAGTYVHEYRIGNGAVVAKSRLVAYAVSDQMRHVEALLGPYTPGTNLDIRLHHYIAGGGVGNIQLHEGTGKQAMLRASPVG